MAVECQSNGVDKLGYVRDKVFPVMDALSLALIVERPEEPDVFLAKFLQERTLKRLAIDKGGGGGSQYEAAQIAAPKSIPEVVESMFRKHDTNGDGWLSFDEFQHALLEEGVPSYMASIIFFMNDRDHDGRIDKNEFAATHEMVQKPMKSWDLQTEPTLKQLATQVVGEPHFLQELTFLSSQTGGSHLGAFFQDTAGGKFYVKFPGLSSMWNNDESSRQTFVDIQDDPQKFYDGNAVRRLRNKQSQKDKLQSKSEVLVSKLYGMVGVESAFMRFVFCEGHEDDGPIGLWSRNMGYDDIGTHEMQGLKGLKEGFAADCWLANWDVIGNGSPPELNMKRTKDGRAFRLDFGGCLQYRATGGDKAETGCPFTADAVPEVDTLRRYNRVFNDVTDADIAAGVARIVAGATDSGIRDVVNTTLGNNAGNIAEILIGRKKFLMNKFPSPSTTVVQSEDSVAAKPLVAIPAVVEDIFRRHDNNGEGWLNFDKFCNALQEEGVPSYMASIIFFMNDRNHDGKIDKHEFAATHEMVQKPLKAWDGSDAQADTTLKTFATQVVGEPHFLQELSYVSSQTGGSHLGSFFQDTAGGKFYVKFPGLSSMWNDDESSQQIFSDIQANPRKYYDREARGKVRNKQSWKDKLQSRSEVLVSKLYGMVGVEAAFMRFVFLQGAEEDGPIGLWSRNMGYDDIGTYEMQGLKGLKEGFAADAWLANWDVIGNGSPAELNMKRTKDGRAFRLDFGGCLQYRATGGDKAETGCPFSADAVPEVDTLRRYNRVFNDVTDLDIAAGVAKIVAGATDSSIRDVVQATLGSDAGNIAEILIGRRDVLMKRFPPPLSASEQRCKELELKVSELEAQLQAVKKEAEQYRQQVQSLKNPDVEWLSEANFTRNSLRRTSSASTRRSSIYSTKAAHELTAALGQEIASPLVSVSHGRPDNETLLKVCKGALLGWSQVDSIQVTGLHGGATYQMVLRVAANAFPQNVVVKINLRAAKGSSGAFRWDETGLNTSSSDISLESIMAASLRTLRDVCVAYYVPTQSAMLGVTVMEFVAGGVVSDANDAAWMDQVEDAKAFGRLVARFHQQPLDVLAPIGDRLTEHIRRGGCILAENHPYEVLRKYFCDDSLFESRFAQVLEAAQSDKYGHSCLEILGFATGLRESLKATGGRHEDEVLTEEELGRWVSLLDFVIGFAPQVYGLFAGRSLLSDLVVGHGDLHSKNLIRRKAGITGDMVLIDFDRVHRMPAGIDIASPLLLSYIRKEEPYPSYDSRSSLARAYLETLGKNDESLVDAFLFDIEKGVMVQALLAAIPLIRSAGLQDAWLPTWRFVGLCKRGFDVLAAAEGNLQEQRRIIVGGLKPILLEDVNPFADLSGEELLNTPGAAERWFPDVSVAENW